MATERLSMRQDTRDPAAEVGAGAEPPGGGAQPRREHRGGGDGGEPREARRARTGRRSSDSATTELEERLYGAGRSTAARRAAAAGLRRSCTPSCARPGVTLQLLHLEYLEQHPDGYRYTPVLRALPARGCAAQRRRRCARCTAAGEKLFVDYSGKKPRIVDPQTGEVRRGRAVRRGARRVELHLRRGDARRRRSPDFIASHVRALRVLRRRARARWCPTSSRAAVTMPCRYEPGIQRTYEEMARHYGTAIVPARPAQPRDKAKVEAGVLVAQRWILARLRNETFFSLDALNERIAELLEELNDRPMRLYGASRRELFERLDRPALQAAARRALRLRRVEDRARSTSTTTSSSTTTSTRCRTRSVHEQVDVRATATTVEIFLRGRARRVARCAATRAAAHDDRRAHAEGAPEARRVDPVAASSAGPRRSARRRRSSPRRSSPSAAPRAGLPLVPGHPAARRSATATSGSRRRARARWPSRARSYRHVESILKHGLDRRPATRAPAEPQPHENPRGTTPVDSRERPAAASY